MTASVRQLVTAGSQRRYPDHVDLRRVIRQGTTMTQRITYSSDAWNLVGAGDFDGHSSPVLHFERIPAPWRNLVKDYLLLVGDPGLARTWNPGAAADNHAGRRRAHWATARTAGKRTGRLLRLMEELGMTSLTPGDWILLVEEARTRAITNPSTGQVATMSPETLARGAQVLREIHDLGQLHGREAPFGSRPWGAREINEAVGFRPPTFGERRNAVRPHGHVFAMAGACMNLLNRCGDDLVARADWWTRRGDTRWNRDRPDPFRLNGVDTRPEWLPQEDHLLPEASGDAGLWWWTNRLVFAAYYVVAAVTGLRGAEMDALSPDCISTVDGNHTMRGLRIKGQSVTNPPEGTWTVNDAVVQAVGLVNRLRSARQLRPPVHPRLTARPLLFSADLLADDRESRRRKTFLCRPLEPGTQRLWLVPAMERLHAADAGESVEGLTLCSHTTIRNTSLDVHVDRPLGDLAAAAVGKWSTISVALGYIGHRPQVTTPAWSDEVVERNVERSLGPLVVGTALQRPETLTGAGAARLTREAAADHTLANGPVTSKVLRGAIRRSHASVSIGILSACVGPTGGLCGGTKEANHRLCQLGCSNMVLTPYHRARLELMRRSMSRLLGPESHLVAKVDAHDDLFAGERVMTTDELVDVLTAEWDPKFRHLVLELLGVGR